MRRPILPPRLRRSIRAVFGIAILALTVAAPAGEPEATRPDNPFATRFRQNPSGPTALMLARQGNPDELRAGMALPEPAPALVAWALAQYPAPDLREALEDLLPGADQVAGYWAARALGRLEDAAAIPALARQFPESDKGFWEFSEGGPNARRKMYYFRDVVRNGQPVREGICAPDDMPNIRVAYAAALALGDIGGPEAERILIHELDRDHYLIRSGAARAIGALRAPAALPKLTELAEKDPVLLVRRAAAAAIDAIAGTPQLPEANPPPLPPAIAFIKTRERTESNFGYRDSYPYPRLPWYAAGQAICTLTPPQPDGTLRCLIEAEQGAVQGLEASPDGTRLLFAMRRDNATDAFHIYEMNADGSGLRQLTDGNCNDVDPQYLPDGRIVFCSDRAGHHEFYHQERSRVLHTMNADGSDIRQISFNPNADFEPVVLPDGRILYGSYRFYGWDGGPTAVPQDPAKGISRIETVLHSVLPDGSGEHLFYGSMRGGFYTTLRPTPYANQFQTTAWPRTDQMIGVSVSFPRVLPDGRVVCVTPAGLTVVDRTLPYMDCELPLYPEVLNLAGGEEVYIHSFDDQNPVGRYTAPYPVGGNRVLVSHAPWYDLRANGYGLYLLDLETREQQLVYDDPDMSDVDAVALVPRDQPRRMAPPPDLGPDAPGTVYCQSVFHSDLPFDRKRVARVRVMEAVQVGMSMNGNLGFQTRILADVPVDPDGSFFVEVPADTPFRFALFDDLGQLMVHETEFMYVRPGETKGCIGCHEPKDMAPPAARGTATLRKPYRAIRKPGDLVYGGRLDRPYNFVVRE